jgi:dTDP-4-dehydrorhamnose reductase
MTGSILFIGGDSEIATATGAHLRTVGFHVTATTRRPERVSADRPFLDLSQPVEDWPIPDGVRAACFCAAIARLNNCAHDPEGSALVNVSRTIALTDKLLARGLSVLFLSTDKVFDGSRPRVPAATSPCPVSEYGKQKAAAEAALGERMQQGAPVAILRLAKIVSPGMELLRQWIASLRNGMTIRAFEDMMMAPTPVRLVAKIIEHLTMDPNAGIFQLSGPRDVAYSEVAFRLADIFDADPALVEAVSAYSAGLPPGSTAPHTTLDSSALRERFGIYVPDAWAVIDALIETCR